MKTKLFKNQSYKYFLANGFATGIECFDTLENIIASTEKCSRGQNTTNWLFVEINGKFEEIGRTSRHYQTYSYNYEFDLNSDFEII